MNRLNQLILTGAQRNFHAFTLTKSLLPCKQADCADLPVFCYAKAEQKI